MNIVQLIRIFLRHLWLLVSIPILLALIVAYLTRNPTFKYESETKIYTGIASGSDLEQNNRVDYFATNNQFDNLINVIKSRETIGEVAIRLLAQGLVLDNYNPVYLSKESFIELRKMTPPNIKDLVVKPLIPEDSVSFAIAMNKTVKNFINYKNSSDTNYIYNLLNYNHRFYSIKAISRLSVKRIQNSDIIEISYQSEDPGITLQTLNILTNVFSRNYTSLRENQSDVVVNYFQNQVDDAQERLRTAEQKLKDFNTDNKIINYYEQSKFIAGKKETIEEYIQNEKMKLTGAEQALQRLEDKLDSQEQVQFVSDNILDKRNRLVKITEKITINELYNESDTVSKNELAKLKLEAEKLKEEINSEISRLYTYRNTIEGLPISSLLNEWLKNIVVYAEAKAGLQVLEVRQREFQKNYDVFAPLGATMKKIEREIDVAEREYLSLLHSLNQARLDQQNQSLGSNIKPLDPPYFPLSPIPSKRKILVLAAALLGFIIVAFAVLLAEYFDNSIKNIERAEKFTGLKAAGLMPKIIGKYRSYDLSFITNRLTELLYQEVKHHTRDQGKIDTQQTKVIIVASTQDQEGKSFVVRKLANRIRSMGERVLYLNYTIDTGYQEDVDFEPADSDSLKRRKKTDQDASYLDITLNKDNQTFFIDEHFPDKQDVFELIPTASINTLDNFKYIFIEFPPMLQYPFPGEIVKNSDLSLLVVRANREWKNADSNVLNFYMEIADKKPLLVLNGTQIEEVEAKLGTLPKKRSRIRRTIKKLINFQFYTRESIS